MSPIDFSRFKILYRNKVLTGVALLHFEIDPTCDLELFTHGFHRLSEITLLALDENGYLTEICDEAREFQFVPRV